MVRFGRSLAGSENAALRRKIRMLAGRQDTLLHVDTVLAMYAQLDHVKPPKRVAGSFLLFDWQRFLFYKEPPVGAGPFIDSVVLHLLDAYPLQPIGAVMEHCAMRPYRFGHPVNRLDLLSHVLLHADAGLLIVGDLVSSEVRIGPAHPHPNSRRLQRVPPRQRSAPPALALQRCWTDESLRTGVNPGLSGLVSRDAGIVRSEGFVSGFQSLPFARAEIMSYQGTRRTLCYGKSFRAAHGRLAALCEALERFQVRFLPPDEVLVHGSYGELHAQAVDPKRLFFPCDQDSSPNPYTAERRMYWSWASDPIRGETVLVPAQEIWFGTEELPGEQVFVRSGTNACAVGSTVEEAAVFALLEAIERDAYMTMWYLRRPCARIDLDSIDNEPFQLLRRRWEAVYESYDLQIFDITNDIRVPAVTAIALRTQGDGPQSFHAAAACLSADRACFSALADLAGFSPSMSSVDREMRFRLLEEPERIASPEDHFGLYSLDETLERLDFLGTSGAWIRASDVNVQGVIPVQATYDLKAVIHKLAEHLRQVGSSLLLKNLTHDWIGRRGLYCVKAITPGLYPIWFGPKASRFAVTQRLVRLSQQFAGRQYRCPSEYNLSTHPLG